jgi:uncharacterized protein YuzE
MKIEYDQATDSLYISLSDSPSVESAEVSPDVVMDYGENGKVFGIDLQHASEKANIDQMIFERVA